MVAIGKMFSLLENVRSSIAKDNRGVSSGDVHIHEAMQWLLRAQKMTNDDGVSEGFHLYHGWLSSYPETTGYMIETFCNYAVMINTSLYRESAIRMADWLCSIQKDDGSIPDSYFSKKMVFDTGQAIFGFAKIFNITGENKYQNAAVKAADWLISQQEKDGSWIKHASNNIPHAYYSRVAWSLLKVHEITSVDRYVESCMKNIEWCISQQQNNGWFKKASFNLSNHHRPFTHTIAYTIRGILESGAYLQNDQYIKAAKKAMDHLAGGIHHNGFVSGTFDKDWKGDNKFTCLTGNAQLSIIFLRLAIIQKAEEYFKTATVVNRYLKSRQNISTNNLNIRGAIAGSYPLWGAYIHFTYPNWATKFFVDTLMLEEEVKKLLNIGV